MRIPDEKVDEIRSATDIVELVSAVTRLKKRGKNFVGLCPFHQEKTPSFTVSPEKQMFHCFGCGKGGNVFTFVMELEKVSFVEAVRSLAARAGISVSIGPAGPRETENERLLAVCRFAAELFHRNLFTPEGNFALEYFRSRGFSDTTIKRFGLGYAIDAWDGLIKAATLEGISTDQLIKAGLVRTKEGTGSHYDYFRGRAMFPILTPTGRVIAFGARRIRDNDPIQGKYINSPDTSLYNKSQVLYGLFQSKEAIRAEENALMVEGYVDMISLFQAGIENVVASSGTALTEDQVKLVGRYARTLTLVYDADSAGSQAMVRGLDVALEQGLDVRIVPLPQKHDPDSFVREFGAKEFRRLLERAVSFIDFKISILQEAGKFSSAEGEAEAITSIAASIAKIPDELRREIYVKHIASRYGIREISIQRTLERFRPVQRRQASPRTFRSERPLRPSAGSVAQAPKRPELSLIGVLLTANPETATFLLENLREGDVTDQRLLAIIDLCRRQLATRGEIDYSTISNEIDEDLRNTISELIIDKYGIGDWARFGKEVERGDTARIARDTLVAVRIENLKRQRDTVRMQIQQASTTGAETTDLKRQFYDLEKEIDKLKQKRGEASLHEQHDSPADPLNHQP